MRYQLPDGVTSISAGPNEYTADADGIIDVPLSAGADVHKTLQDPRLHALKPLDDVPGAIILTPDVEATVLASEPTEIAAPLRESKRFMLGLLRSLGYVIDGRATFQFLSRKVRDALDKVEADAAAAKAAPEPAADAPADPAAVDAAPAADAVVLPSRTHEQDVTASLTGLSGFAPLALTPDVPPFDIAQAIVEAAHPQAGTPVAAPDAAGWGTTGPAR